MSASGPRSTICPRCQGPSVHRFDASDRNRAVSDRRFAYRRCTVCGVIWLQEIPPDLERYYPADYHEFLGGDELAAAAAEEADRLALISRHAEPGQMVEIGPSQGVFAVAARRGGFEVVALEMDEACCRHLRDVVGVQAVKTAEPAVALAGLGPSRAVVMWHVLEHLPEPWSVLAAVAENLEPGGILAVATPNPDSIQARVFGARWVHLDAPRHITLIPLSALGDELQKLGLYLVEATTADQVGRDLNRLGWERSILRPPTLRPDPRLAHTAGRALTSAACRWEEQDLAGAAYTAIFKKGAARSAP